MILFEMKRRQPVEELGIPRAARRKAAWSARREGVWMASVYGSCSSFILLVTAQFIYAKTVSELSPLRIAAVWLDAGASGAAKAWSWRVGCRNSNMRRNLNDTGSGWPSRRQTCMVRGVAGGKLGLPSWHRMNWAGNQQYENERLP